MKKHYAYFIPFILITFTGCGLLVEREKVWINAYGERATPQEISDAKINCRVKERVQKAEQALEAMKSNPDATQKEVNEKIDQWSNSLQGAFTCMRKLGLTLQNRPVDSSH
ncbi:hypothetical protein [Enterovibrio norvegicus]|uniref:hypothetical protein n=1 Tax=Enterovibrio norvegicus TaxID=188144 RepID=UPI00030F8EAC|nr:hypothetical protein [Enterovibrio norvegicus]OEF57979.1 hypothetical protein A1OU_07160 [Enterovibrio norvegicus]